VGQGGASDLEGLEKGVWFATFGTAVLETYERPGASFYV
jgi:hypothetical protein